MLKQVCKIGCCILMMGLLSIPAWGMGNDGTGTQGALVVANGVNGPGDGTGNGGDGPADGSGNGAPDGAGTCPDARIDSRLFLAGNGNAGSGSNGGNGPGDGTGNGGDGPADGSGNGAPDGAGICPGAWIEATPLLASNGNAGSGANGGNGPGDGTGNGGDGPADGSGNGAPDGAGTCPDA